MIGTDIIAIARMRALYEKYPSKTAEKILHPKEFPHYQHSRDKARFLAKHWAAKEAISKAIGTGLRHPVLMPAMYIEKDTLGAPIAHFNADINTLLQQHKISKIALTLSDEQAYVVAFAMCVY